MSIDDKNTGRGPLEFLDLIRGFGEGDLKDL